MLLPEEPNQPANFAFPKRSFGKKQIVKRSFQSTWFRRWKWLHYEEAIDSAFCHICGRAEQDGKLKAGSKEQAFLLKGFCNWKDATDCFRRHEQSKCHKDALQVMVVLPNSVRDIGETLSTAHARNKAENRKVLMKILQNIKFLGRQAIALRGHEDSESNFFQLLKLRECDNPEISQWLKRKGDKYLSPDVQNEILQLMSLSILRSIAKNVQDACYFTVMADESVDISNREQLVICFRWVDQELLVHEDFVGLYEIPDISADTLVAAIKDCLLRMNLQLKRCRGQCYDGAASMAGSRTGVATQILSLEPRALYTHCYGHSLSLAMCDTMKLCKGARDALDITFEISKLLKYSPKRHAMFEKLKKELAPDTPGFRVLCPTRWTVRGESLRSVLENYTVLQDLWDAVLENTLEAEVRSRIIGVKAQMETFHYFFGVCIGERILKHADNLSKTLQSSTISSAEGQRVAELTITTLEKMRDGEQYHLFWELIRKKASALQVGEPVLPRRRKVPVRLETGAGEAYFPLTVEDYYRQSYFEVLDASISCIRRRFNQPGYATLRLSESLLLKAAQGENFSQEFESVTSFYGDDFSPSTLSVQLETLATQFHGKSSTTLQDVVAYMKTFSTAELAIYSEVITLLKLILVNPSTNAVSERTFSAMRRIKTYLRSTMSQSRLNATMILHVHKEHTSELSLVNIANSFVNSEHRMRLFGTFSELDV